MKLEVALCEKKAKRYIDLQKLSAASLRCLEIKRSGVLKPDETVEIKPPKTGWLYYAVITTDSPLLRFGFQIEQVKVEVSVKELYTLIGAYQQFSGFRVLQFDVMESFFAVGFSNADFGYDEKDFICIKNVLDVPVAYAFHALLVY